MISWNKMVAIYMITWKLISNICWILLITKRYTSQLGQEWGGWVKSMKKQLIKAELKMFFQVNKQSISYKSKYVRTLIYQINKDQDMLVLNAYWSTMRPMLYAPTWRI